MEIYLKFDNVIVGDVKAKSYENSIRITSYHQAFDNEGLTNELAASKRARSNVVSSGVMLSKLVDCSSLSLFDALHKGVVFKKASLHFARPDKTNLVEFYSMEMENVMIKSIEQSADVSEDGIDELVHLMYSSIHLKLSGSLANGAKTKNLNTADCNYATSTVK